MKFKCHSLRIKWRYFILQRINRNLRKTKKKYIHAWRSLMNTISRKNINCLRSKIVYTVHNTTALVNFSTMNIIPFRVFIEIGEENYYELVRSIVQIIGESESGYWPRLLAIKEYNPGSEIGEDVIFQRDNVKSVKNRVT